VKGRRRRPHPSRTGAAEPDPPEIRESAISLLPGQALCANLRLPSGSAGATFIIRETRDRLEAMGKHPKLKLRCVLLDHRGILPLVVLIRINDDREMIYEIWIDYHGPSGAETVNELVEQNNLSISFYTAAKRWRRIPVHNNQKLARDARAARARCEKSSPWTREEFHESREALFEQHPTVLDLWNLAEN
jgi:hypothetical protein